MVITHSFCNYFVSKNYTPKCHIYLSRKKQKEGRNVRTALKTIVCNSVFFFSKLYVSIKHLYFLTASKPHAVISASNQNINKAFKLIHIKAIPANNIKTKRLKVILARGHGVNAFTLVYK